MFDDKAARKVDQEISNLVQKILNLIKNSEKLLKKIGLDDSIQNKSISDEETSSSSFMQS